jgi:hypothetical protein
MEEKEESNSEFKIQHCPSLHSLAPFFQGLIADPAAAG